jgi:hypothetical protein
MGASAGKQHVDAPAPGTGVPDTSRAGHSLKRQNLIALRTW